MQQKHIIYILTLMELTTTNIQNKKLKYTYIHYNRHVC